MTGGMPPGSSSLGGVWKDVDAKNLYVQNIKKAFCASFADLVGAYQALGQSLKPPSLFKSDSLPKFGLFGGTPGGLLGKGNERGK